MFLAHEFAGTRGSVEPNAVDTVIHFEKKIGRDLEAQYVVSPSSPN